MFHLSYSQEDPIMFGVKFLCARYDFKCKRRGKEGKKKKKEKKKEVKTRDRTTISQSFHVQKL